MIKQWAWRSLAFAAIALAAIGVILPGLPTTPFLLVSAWAAKNGWPPLEEWLLNHVRYGAVIRDWRSYRVVPRKAKWLASGLMLSTVVMIWLSPVPDILHWLLPVFLLCVAIWLWRQADTPPSSHG
ncbi:MAG: YbaN family protein [Porticoccaceae bacterium]